MRRMLPVTLSIGLSALAIAAFSQQEADEVRANYTKHEYLVPMRLLPGSSDHFMKERFIFVYQDVRGRHMSQGEFVEIRPHDADKKSRQEIDESTDTYDTIEWLVQNVPHHNGKVGMWGISYPGFYVAVGMIDATTSSSAWGRLRTRSPTRRPHTSRSGCAATT